MPGLWNKIYDTIVKGKSNDQWESDTDWLNNQTATEVRVVVKRPHLLNDKESIAAIVKNGQAVVVNVEQMQTGTAQRMVDFLSGATYAINGNMEKIGAAMFLFAPGDVHIHSKELAAFRSWPGK